MKRLLFPLLLLLTFLPLAAFAQKAASLQIEATGTPELSLRGKEARQQLLVTGALSDGALRDFTHKATYSAAPAGIVSIDPHGLVTAVADGATVITAAADGVTSTLPVKVEGSAKNLPLNFGNQIVPI